MYKVDGKFENCKGKKLMDRMSSILYQQNRPFPLIIEYRWHMVSYCMEGGFDNVKREGTNDIQRSRRMLGFGWVLGL